jgi:glycine cleavage system H protein
MPEYLEATVDKFIFKVASDRLYAAEGVWVLWLEPREDGQVRLGLTDYLQQHGGDLTFANVKPAGTTIAAGEPFAEIETIKTTIVLYAPVAGEVVAVNPALDLTPEVVNQDPYGAGWLAVFRTSDWEADRAKLLDPEGYLAVMKQQAEEELNRS